MREAQRRHVRGINLVLVVAGGGTQHRVPVGWRRKVTCEPVRSLVDVVMGGRELVIHVKSLFLTFFLDRVHFQFDKPFY